MGSAIALPLLLAGLVSLVVAVAGKRLRPVRMLGLDVVAALLFPAWLASTGSFEPAAIGWLDHWFEKLRLMDWFVAIVVIGSLAEVDLRQLGRTAAALPLPVLAGSLLALAGGTVAAVLLAGANAKEALFLNVVPVLAGGISVGAMPLANGYAEIQGTDVGEMLGLILPSVVLGNLLAILIAASMRRSERAQVAIAPQEPKDLSPSPANLWLFVPAVGCIVMLQLAAWLGQSMAAIPTSLILIALVILIRVAGLLDEQLRLTLVMTYRQCVRWLLFPMLTLVGLLVLPWNDVVAGLTAPTLVSSTAVTLCLVAAGRAFASHLQLSGRSGGTLFLARAAMGGSGNLTILAAANRMELMSLAMILTRLGGVLTVAGALALMRLL